jgi:RNA ligase (TIGR02306 family)
MSDKLVSCENILNVTKHPNADSLDICTVLGYEVITKLGQYKIGEKIVFIQPDSVLPDKPWASFYKSKSSRVRAIKLRGSWSMGVIESFASLDLDSSIYNEGDDLTEITGVYKFESPQPNDNSARSLLPFGIPKTDEDRWQSISKHLPFGELVDVTLKLDGQSASYFVKIEDGKVVDKGILGRTLCFKSETENNYTRQDKRYGILEKLEKYCLENNISICLRGESHGSNIQNFSHNPHAKLPLDIAFFSVFLIDEKKYARKGHELYFIDFCKELNLPTVPIIESNVLLTQELINKYDNILTEINGKPFEGVVMNHYEDSFKVISKKYDSLK